MLCDEILITVTALGRSSLSKTPELTCDYCWAEGEDLLVHREPASDHPSLTRVSLHVYVCGTLVHAFGSVFISIRV